MTTVLAKIKACHLSEEGDWVGFRFQEGLGGEGRGLAMRVRGEVRAYRNLCPHWSTPLDQAGGGDPVDTSCGEVVCLTHGARFNAVNGECVSGPCLGERLDVFAVEESGDEVVIRRGALKLG